MYRNSWNFRANPAGKLTMTNALWFCVTACAFFTAYVNYVTYRQSSINDYLVSHPTQTAQATVTKVFSEDHWLTKHPWCAIFVEASFTDPTSGRKASLTGTDHYGFIGTHIQWSDCDDRLAPVGHGRKIAVGDHVPVVYAIANPLVNRPGWMDYGFQVRRGWPVCWTALGITVLLTIVTMRYRRSARSNRAPGF